MSQHTANIFIKRIDKQMKKIISIILITVIILAFTSCSSNRKLISNGEYNKAVIRFPDGSIVEVEIKNWTLLDNDELVIISKDGTKYLVNSVNCILIRSE